MSEPLALPAPEPGQQAWRTYRIDRPQPDAAVAAFAVIQLAQGHETLMRACATMAEAVEVRVALEQLDAAEALARRLRPSNEP
jgi:hypothetical protein